MSFISPVATDASGQQRATGSLQELGRNDFLQLLVTKLQYQDPLNPMQDEDFIAQLAQFSSLEQMTNISEGIESSNQWDYLQMQSLNNMMASGLIGNEIKAEYSGVYIDGSSEPTISYTLDEYAEDIKFEIRNLSGDLVATLTAEEVAPGTGSITWDGRDQHGNTVDEGYYTVEATATDSAGDTFEPALSLVGIVESIIYRDGSAYLKVNGMEIPLGDVAAVGAPGSFSGETGDGTADDSEDI